MTEPQQLSREELASLADLAAVVREGGLLWLFARRDAGRFVATEYLRTGDAGAVLLAVPPGDTHRWEPGDAGRIGGGSNHFQVQLALIDGDDVDIAVGWMERGGFHASKHNFTVGWRPLGPA